MQIITANQSVATTCGCSTHAEPVRMRKRIGSTVYEVRVYFNQDAKETMDEKILRIIHNDLNESPEDGIMGLPQTGRLPERGSA